MKRKAMSMLLAMSLAASIPAGIASADELVLSPGNNTLQADDREDPSSPGSILDQMNNSNASMLESLGKKDWAALAASVQKTGKWRDDLVAVAQTQVGYTQEDDGATLYTRWADLKEPVDSWTALFVNWCAEQTGLTKKQFPRGNTFDEVYRVMDKVHAVKKISRATYPASGDLALIETKTQQLVGIVVYVSGGYASIIHGDDDGRVTRATYMVNGAEFKRYVDLTVLMERAGLDTGKGGEAPVIPEDGVAAWTNTNAVYMRSEPTTASKSVTTVKKSGTALLVTSAEMQEDGYIWYGVKYKNYIGFIRSDLLRLDESALHPQENKNDPLSRHEEHDRPDAPALGRQERVVNIEVVQTSAGQAVSITFDIYGATAYEWHEVRTDAQGSTDRILPGASEATLTITAKSDADYSYYCVAVIGASGKSVEVTSKTTALNVNEGSAAAPITAEAILGEEVNFSYSYEGAVAYQWYVNNEAISPDDAAYTGANASRLTFHAVAEHAGSLYHCLALDAQGRTIQKSGEYTLAIKDTASLTNEDLVKYVDELAHMTPAERYTALSETWNITAVINGSQTTLSAAVSGCWRAALQESYPNLLCTCGSQDAPGMSHSEDCPWFVYEIDTEDPSGLSVYYSCAEFPDACAITSSWLTRNASPLEIYTHLSGLEYDARFNLLMHAGAAHPQSEKLLCSCFFTDEAGDLLLIAPGAEHDEGCPWYAAQAISSAIVPVTDARGSIQSYSLVMTDASGVPVTAATTTCLDGVYHYFRDAASGVYVAYLHFDENGQPWIIPLASET